MGERIAVTEATIVALIQKRPRWGDLAESDNWLWQFIALREAGGISQELLDWAVAQRVWRSTAPVGEEPTPPSVSRWFSNDGKSSVPGAVWLLLGLGVVGILFLGRGKGE